MRRLFSKIPYWYFLILPSFVYGLGFAINAIVLAMNGNQMPVLVPGGCDGVDFTDRIHTCLKFGTHLKFLSDWVLISANQVASPADFLIWLGDKTMWPCFMTWAALILRERKEAIVKLYDAMARRHSQS